MFYREIGCLYVLLSVMCFSTLGCGGPHPTGDQSTASGDDQTTDDTGASQCTNADDCSGGDVCHPYLGTCVSPGDACEGLSDCPDGSYCENALGVCLPAATGTPCLEDANCEGTCEGGFCGCDGLAYEQQLVGGSLDVYLILDRSGSMGDDCEYQHGSAPPVSSKACFATYALSDYLIDVPPKVDTRLAFQFFSLEDNCDVTPYATPLVDLTQLPVTANDKLITEISDETFDGYGLQTRMEPALRGIAAYTAAHQTPGREMIGVLMTDGDANRCESDIEKLSEIIAAHRTATGLKTYIIGMDGATENKLEQLAVAGGAEAHQDFCGSLNPPCHYWNVGSGSGDAVANALQAIAEMAVPLPCHFGVTGLEPPPGETLDYNRINVTLTQGSTTTIIGQVPGEAACPEDQPAWYYDNPSAPTEIYLCPNACSLVTSASEGARVNVVVGCQDTVTVVI